MTTKEEIAFLGGIYIENIQDGFDKYEFNMLKGTEDELYQKIEELYHKNGNEYSFVDFYYGKLSSDERDNLRKHLSDRAFFILNRYEYLKEPVFLSIDKDVLFLTAEFNAKELLFCTYYFCKYPCTVWGNYNLNYPMFYNKNESK